MPIIIPWEWMSGACDFRRVLWLPSASLGKRARTDSCCLPWAGEGRAQPYLSWSWYFLLLHWASSLVRPHRPLLLGEFFLNDQDSSFTPFPCLSISSPWHIPEIFLEIQKSASTGQWDWRLWNSPNSKMAHLSQANQRDLLLLSLLPPVCEQWELG